MDLQAIETATIIDHNLKKSPNEAVQAMKNITQQAGVRTPQFPGCNPQTIEQVRKIIRSSKKCKGFDFNIPAGQAENQLNLSGSARILLGFAIYRDPSAAAADWPDVSITINEEIMIDQTNAVFFTPDFMDDEYYYFPRPLSGQDTIILRTDAPAIFNPFYMAVYWI